MAAVALVENSVDPLAVLPQVNSPSPIVNRIFYSISEESRNKLPNQTIPPLKVYRSITKELLRNDEDKRQSTQTEASHGLDSENWKPHQVFLESERALNISKENGVKFKLIHMLRHAQGIHNEAEATVGTPHWNAVESLKPEYTDPHLTEK